LHYYNLQCLRVAAPCAAIVAIVGLSATASAASSSAFDVSAQLTSGGVTTVIAPVNPLNGGGITPNYGKSSTVLSYQKVVQITKGPMPAPAFSVYATSLKSHVSGGFGVDTMSSEGDTLIKGLAVSLNLYPPPPGATSPVPQPSLQITANTVQSSANYNIMLPMAPAASATVSFGSLTISGSLVGNQTVKLSGTPQTDTVIYQSPTVTITLNRQIVAGLISCTPKCTFTPYSVSGAAIDIVLNNATVSGRTVSGEIVIGGDQAGGGTITANAAGR
jgi:hypothetical protein